MSYLHLSRSISSYISGKARVSAEQEEIINYAIEVLLLNLINTFFTLFIGWLFGVLLGTFTSLAVIAYFRQSAGGAHSSSALRCTIITVLVIPSIALLADRISNFDKFYLDTFSLISILVVFITILYLAPVGSASAPITSSKRRKKLKIFSVIGVFIILILIFYFRQRSDYSITNSILLSSLWVSFNLTKSGHNLMSLIDGLGKLTNKGV